MYHGSFAAVVMHFGTSVHIYVQSWFAMLKWSVANVCFRLWYAWDVYVLSLVEISILICPNNSELVLVCDQINHSTAVSAVCFNFPPLILAVSVVCNGCSRTGCKLILYICMQATISSAVV
jgi:hypothetical protein